MRKLWWEHNGKAWKATVLRTTVTLIDAGDEETPGPDDIHARFQNDDWECAPIEKSPWPFDPGLRFEKNGSAGSLAWKIVDSNGGELIQVHGDDGGELVYTLGKKTTHCTLKGLSTGILNDFADFEHRLADTEDYEDEVDESSDDDDGDASSGECATCDNPAGKSGWCDGCLQKVMRMEKKKKKKQKQKRRDAKAAAAKAAAAEATRGKKRKVDGKSAPKTAKKKRGGVAATASKGKDVTFASSA